MTLVASDDCGCTRRVGGGGEGKGGVCRCEMMPRAILLSVMTARCSVGGR